MRRLAGLTLLAVGWLGGEVHRMTLRQAVELALKQNPEVALARLEETKAEQAVRLAQDRFWPKLYAGSGLAYSSGFPMSIEGATPSIVQAGAMADVFNRSQSHRIAAARENRRSASLGIAAKQEEVAFRTAELYLEAERSARVAQVAAQRVTGLERVAASVEARVAEGRELPIETRRAALELARARHRHQALEAERACFEGALAEVLGLEPGDRVAAAGEERRSPATPASEEEAVRAALANSQEIRRLESQLVAKGFDIRAERAARLPKFDLVAQYAVLGRFNNYEDFFRKFQRHNGQLGVAIQVPLWTGPGVKAAISRAESEAAQLRLRIQSARRHITGETARLQREVRQAESARELARLDLDVAREQVSLLLAQHEEGRLGLRQLEEARAAEAEKWMAFYGTAAGLERARLNLLRQTGTLLAAVQ
ncbi:MAG: TolC family protein [Acidobacteria bacterium]|nr:TolC family protein [Acidobacteriota bacterium]